jgi:5-methylcytosine-specific restriction protein A
MHPSQDKYKDFYKTDEWWALRQRTLRVRGFCCEVCKRSVQGKGNARVDHITPIRVDWSRRLDPTNLRVLCTSCDNKRHSEKASGVVKEEIGYDGYPAAWR